MLDFFTVSFFGHRRLEQIFTVEQRLETIIDNLLREKEYVEFLVGRDGEFDLLAASVVKRCKRRMDTNNCALVWVLPYPTAEFRASEESFREYYDEIEICDVSSQAHYKGAFQARNREMVDRSSLVICCVERQSGGAYQAMRYALKNTIPVINLSELEEECERELVRRFL